MLGKLIKYNNKSIIRIMAPCYIILACITAFTQIANTFTVHNTISKVIHGLSTFAAIIAIIGTAFACFAILIYHFYKNLLCDQAYFTFTLPASIKQHIVSNTIVGTFWMLLSMFLCLVSGTALCAASSHQEFMEQIQQLRIFLSSLRAEGISVNLFGILFLFLIILCIIAQILTIQLCFSAGQMYTGSKLIGSVIAYIIIYIVHQVLGGLISAPFFIKYGLRSQPMTAEVIPSFTLSMFLMVFIIIIASFYLTQFFLSRKLNLE